MLDDYLASHATSLKLRSQRTKLLASNIANADTPNYKARDMAFAEVLNEANGSSTRVRSTLKLSGSTGNGLATTNSRHMTNLRTTSTSAPTLYRVPDEASLDGNTVDKDMEQARFAENTVRYQASLEFINSRVSSIISALKSDMS